MNGKKRTVLLVGVGGYGAIYVDGILQHPRFNEVEIVGVVDPYAASSRSYEKLVALNVPFFDTVEAFYAENRADIAVISTPIYLHAQQAIFCMENGSNVFVEKPIAATVEEAREMIRTRDQHGRKLGVGFQWCYDETMLRLKADVDAGRLGAPVAMRAMVIWPRPKSYYKRGTGWAGKKYTADGRPVFDNVVSNATAHYLENALWLSGNGYQGAGIAKLEAEGYRANDIEMYDTVCLRATLTTGGKLMFIASHATGPNTAQEPMFEYAYENATVSFGGLGTVGNHITARWQDGSTTDYGVSDPGEGGLRKFWCFVDAVNGGGDVPCPAEAAMAHAEAMRLLHQTVPDPTVFSADDITDTGEMVWVPGLKEKLVACYETFSLLSELPADA